MQTEKPYRFYYHYNKPASLRVGRNQISVHYRNKCHIVDNVILHHVYQEGKHSKTQPRFVMQGYSSKFVVDENNVAHIYP